jgi:hypothetical protein
MCCTTVMPTDSSSCCLGPAGCMAAAAATARTFYQLFLRVVDARARQLQPVAPDDRLSLCTVSSTRPGASVRRLEPRVTLHMGRLL